MKTLRSTKLLNAFAFSFLALAGLGGCSEESPATVEDPNASNADQDEDESDDDPIATVDAGKKDAGKPDSGSTSLIDARTPPPAADAGDVQPDAGQADSGPSTPPVREDLGEGDGKDVITIGDSWMLLSAGTGIEVSLEKTSKRDYRNFGVPGTKLLDEVIPRQYTTAKGQGPVKTVVMTGGGNDIIQDMPTQCVNDAFGDACKAQIDKVAARLVKLWAEMSKDGVQDVVIIGYTRKASLLFSSLSMSAEYSNVKIPPLCAAVPPPLRCHSLDSDTVFDGATREGIHPTNAGYDKIGAAVWELMKKEGMRR